MLRHVSRLPLATAIVCATVSIVGAQQALSTRDPASRAGAILTWPVDTRESYIAALDAFFLTRTVKASTQPRPLERGRPIASFEPGGARADYLRRFTSAERVRGVLVLQHGRIRLERYTAPHGETTRWNSFSIAKSITSTLVGVAMKDGDITDLDDPVTRYASGLRGSAYDDVTIRQLLTMTSGVQWNEDYTDPGSDVARMYATAPDPGFDMTVSYLRKLPHDATPGTKWVYNTAETNLVGVLVAEATGKTLADYLSEKIWRPYGMERDAEWMIDDVGHEQGGCCLAITLRDYGRFGQFILDGAGINGTRIVNDEWLALATHSQVATGAAGSGYGYQWWTRDEGTFEARGIYGQTLHIDPARQLVIVMNSATERPTSPESGRARRMFIAAVQAEVDAEQR